jgi:hypothetical protein
VLTRNCRLVILSVLIQLDFHISFLGYDAVYFDRLGFDMDVLSHCWKVPQDRQLFINSLKIKVVL